MSSVEDRIVNMKFNNSTFEQGANKTLGTLSKLKASLDFSKSTKSMGELQSTASKFSMGGMAGSVEGVSKKFIALGTIAVTAIANITNRAINAGVALVKSFTITPIMAGLENYETKINAIQTILSNTQSAGTKLKDVTGALNELNKYANKTVYNFAEMAKNIGTFTAAGVDLKTATASIKGIANLASLSGSNSQQASTAMYQLSQAISAGQVHLQDWNSVVNAGLGGSVFQRALADTAVAMGTLDSKAVKLKGSMKNVTINGGAFRQSLTPPPGGTSWLTSKVLTTALKTFTGDLTDAQLASLGFKKEQIAAIQAQAKTAVKAATQIKTISQLQQALKEEVASSWSNVWQTIIGDFTQAPKLLSPLHNFLESAFKRPAIDLNKLLKEWAKLGGRTTAIQGIKNAFEAIVSLIKPIKDAFRDIFPAKTGKDLYNATVSFSNFMKQLTLGADTANNLKRTFRGVFAIFDILREVFSGVFHAVIDLFSAITGGNGSILKFTAGIGDFLVHLDQVITEGSGLNDFFNSIVDFLLKPIQMLKQAGTYISNLFSGFNIHFADGVAGAIGGVGAVLSKLGGYADVANTAWGKLVQGFENAKQKLQPIINSIKNFFSNLGQAISDAMGTKNFDDTLKVFNTALLGGIALALKKFLSGGLKINADIGSGLLSKLGGAFEGLTGTLGAMQAQLKTKALMQLAIAIGILAASVVALSLIKPAKLQNAITALAAIFAELLGAMKILTSISTNVGFAKIPVIAASMVLLAGAVGLLVLSVKSLSKLPLDDLKKGLAAVGALLGELSIAVLAMSKSSGGMVRIGLGLIGVAVAIKILASAVKDFAGMQWQDIGKGLTGVAGSLVAVAAGMRVMPKGMVLQAAALVVIASALKLLASDIKTFAGIDWISLGHGLAGIAGALVTIAGAMHLMPKSMLLQSAGLVLVGIALQSIAKAVAKMGGLDWKTIGKGLTTLAGSLAILAIALNAMRGTISGSIALGIASAALILLVPALKALGSMSWSEILHGLVALAGALGVFGIAGLALEPVTPAIFAISVALLAFGAAIALTGAGVYFIAKGISVLAKEGSKGIGVILTALDGFIERLPAMGKGLALGLVNFVEVIGEHAPRIIGALGKIIESLFAAIIHALPKALELFTKLIATFIKAINTNAPKIIDAALNLLVTFLNKITDQMPRIIRSGANLIISFLKGIADNIGRIVDAAFNLIVKFLQGIADGIRKHLPEILKAGANIGKAIIQGLWQGISDFVGWLWDKISGFFSGLWHKILGWFGIHSPSTKAMEIGKAIVQGIWEGVKGLGSWLWSQLSGFFSGIWDKISIGNSKDVNDLINKARQAANEAASSAGDGGGHSGPPSGGSNPNGASADAMRRNTSVAPVLDLSNANKQMAGFSTSVSLDHAASIAAAREAAQHAETTKSDGDRGIKFEQNNYSPKALSAAEIYRQTRSQLSLAKEALNA